METYQNIRVGEITLIHRNAKGEIVEKTTITPDGEEIVERYK